MSQKQLFSAEKRAQIRLRDVQRRGVHLSLVRAIRHRKMREKPGRRVRLLYRGRAEAKSVSEPRSVRREAVVSCSERRRFAGSVL